MPQKVTERTGIIPDVPMELTVYNAAHNKLYTSDDSGALKAFHCPMLLSAAKVEPVEQEKTDSSRHCHGPMGEAPPQNFDAAVSNRTDEINHRVFFESFHKGLPYKPHLSGTRPQNTRLYHALHKFTLIFCRFAENKDGDSCQLAFLNTKREKFYLQYQKSCLFC